MFNCMLGKFGVTSLANIIYIHGIHLCRMILAQELTVENKNKLFYPSIWHEIIRNKKIQIVTLIVINVICKTRDGKGYSLLHS